MIEKEYLEEVPCEICMSRECTREKRFGEWALVRCKSCGLVYVNPRLKQNVLEESFDDKTSVSGEVHLEGNLESYYESIREQQEKTFNRELDFIEEEKEQGRILDVGCGTGLFLELAQSRGWEVQGLEIGSWAEDSLKGKGIPYFLGPLEQAPFEDQTFDVIFLWSTLEHVAHPLELVRHAYRLLRPNGMIWVAGMANYDSLLSYLGLEDFTDNTPPGVVFYFTPRTIRNLYEAAGFARTKVTSEWLSRRSLRIALYPLKPLVNFLLNRFALGSAYRAVGVKES